MGKKVVLGMKVLLVTIICIVLSGYYIWFHSYSLFPNKNEVEKIILTFEPTETLNNKKTVELDIKDTRSFFICRLQYQGYGRRRRGVPVFRIRKAGILQTVRIPHL